MWIKEWYDAKNSDEQMTIKLFLGLLLSVLSFVIWVLLRPIFIQS